jgi:hypothetical protein
MSSEYLTILQLPEVFNSHQLETAYQKSRLRYERLTKRGPLRFYREQLMRDAERAYRSLKRPAGSVPVLDGERPRVLSQRVPVELRKGEAEEKSKQVEREECFCRETLYRLEGDLIRYESRRELLQWAYEHQIPLFRANLLIAQIVESVRQNKLYKTSSVPKGKGKGKRKLSLKAVLFSAAILAVVVDILLIVFLGR